MKRYKASWDWRAFSTHARSPLSELEMDEAWARPRPRALRRVFRVFTE